MITVYIVSLQGVTLVTLDVIELFTEAAMTFSILYLCKKDPNTMPRARGFD